ncbi:hypothetical protein G6F68_018686 [Rhizopus microsporus]|nr:hypothetical protein G6F68_018686 [Rhizopus microsporus]
MPPHLSTSACSQVCRPSGVCLDSGTISAPSSAIFCEKAGSLSAVRSAALNFAMASGGPPSCRGGESGSALMRSSVVTPYSFTRSALICGMVCVVWSHSTSTWPPSSAVIAGAVPA